jgi:transcriptional regulator
MSSAFTRYSPDDVRALIAEFPLAWLVPRSDPAGASCLLPLLGEYGEDGALCAVVGHMSRRNPLLQALATDPRLTVLFSGPQGYVSPRHAGLNDWGPTWNMVQIVVDCEVDLLPEFTEEVIHRQVEVMEPPGPCAWRPSELGERYAGMTERIIGFRARVNAAAAKFKLGQDERGEVLESILVRHPDRVLVEWMRRLNRENA